MEPETAPQPQQPQALLVWGHPEQKTLLPVLVGGETAEAWSKREDREARVLHAVGPPMIAWGPRAMEECKRLSPELQGVYRRAMEQAVLKLVALANTTRQGPKRAERQTAIIRRLEAQTRALLELQDAARVGLPVGGSRRTERRMRVSAAEKPGRGYRAGRRQTRAQWLAQAEEPSEWPVLEPEA